MKIIPIVSLFVILSFSLVAGDNDAVSDRGGGRGGFGGGNRGGEFRAYNRGYNQGYNNGGDYGGADYYNDENNNGNYLPYTEEPEYLNNDQINLPGTSYNDKAVKAGKAGVPRKV